MRTILVVEDNPKIAKAISARLKHVGFAVKTASDAPSALMMARQREPDLAIIDISIPGGTGLDVATNLRDHVCETELPVIFITASKDAEIRTRAQKFKEAVLLSKPFTAKQLVDAIETVLFSGDPEAQLLATQFS